MSSFIDLPTGVPGIITISISGDPRLGRDAGQLADLQAFVETPEGRALLGRGGNGDQVAVAPEDAAGTAGLDVIEPAPRQEGQPGATERSSDVPVKKRVRDWLFTEGPKKSSGR